MDHGVEVVLIYILVVHSTYKGPIQKMKNVHV